MQVTLTQKNESIPYKSLAEGEMAVITDGNCWKSGDVIQRRGNYVFKFGGGFNCVDSISNRCRRFVAGESITINF